MNLKKLNITERDPKRIADAEGNLINALNSLLAEEFQAWYQYFNVAEFLTGPERTSIQQFFKEAAEDELNDHAVKLLKRLNELGSQSYLSTPESWKDYAQANFLTASNLVQDQLDINIQAETAAILHYQEVIELAESYKDYVTRDILKEILADEEEHLSELKDFVSDITKTI